jgi:hypothetical protein
VTVPALATVQSQLSSVFLSSVIPLTRVLYVGGLLDTVFTQYSSAYSATLALINLDANTASGFYIARALSNGTAT